MPTEATVLEIDHRGIARTTAAMGGEGTTLLTLRTADRYNVETLDGALPPDDGEGPANGGWFPGPSGWLLLLEGLEDQVHPWIDRLARSLDEAGVQGKLTGAGTVGQPVWAQRMRNAFHLNGLIGYRPLAGTSPYDGWTPGPQTLAPVVDLGTEWLATHGARLMVSANLRANFWADAQTTRRVMLSEALRTGSAIASGYDKQRVEIRHTTVCPPAGITLSWTGDEPTWRQVLDELRAALISHPLEQVTIAMVGALSWDSLLMSSSSVVRYYDGRAYAWHPERWAEFTLDPCGMQILTNTHLAKAADLSNWATTRLDHGHVLVEARDLDAWYEPVSRREPVPHALLEEARRDFGDMILIPSRAHELGLATNPPQRD